MRLGKKEKKKIKKNTELWPKTMTTSKLPYMTWKLP